MKSDRDQSIERLLRALPRSGGGTSHGASCPDAETLAALADDTLLPAVRREIETHVADCDRCQMLTAALVRSQGLTGVPAREAARVQSWRRRALNWLVPAAAAATAVALWVIVPGQRTSPAEEATLDRQIDAAPPAPAAGATLQAPIDSLRRSPTTSADARPDRAIPSEALPRSSSDLSGRQVVGQPALKAEERAREAAAGAREEVTGDLPPSREAVAGGLQASGQSTGNDAGRRENDTPVEERAAVAAPGRSAASAPASAVAVQARVAGFEVVSSNPQVRWRVGPGAVVQHSADGGMTWAVQQTGATADLTAGSAPSPDVFWLVGRGGIVLRTTDGGRQWQRAPFPQPVDITAVSASNALSAVVNTADGRRFQTTDGGRTWAPVP